MAARPQDHPDPEEPLEELPSPAEIPGNDAEPEADAGWHGEEDYSEEYAEDEEEFADAEEDAGAAVEYDEAEGDHAATVDHAEEDEDYAEEDEDEFVDVGGERDEEGFFGDLEGFGPEYEVVDPSQRRAGATVGTGDGEAVYEEAVYEDQRVENADEDGAAPAPPEELPVAPGEAGADGERPGIRFEVVAVLAAILLVAAGVVIFLAVAVKELGGGSGESRIEFPVRGERLSVAGAETYWRKPDRENDRGVRLSARIIPAAMITLGDTRGSGALRFFFEDDSGLTVGDPVTFTVTNGVFAQSSAKTEEVHATAGFTDEGDHAAYLTDQIATWHLVVKEGPGPDAPGRDFKDLLRIPISKHLR